MLPTGCQQVTDCRPTVGQQSANTLASNITQTVGRQLGNSRPTVGRQLTDSRPTGFLGSSSSQLPKFALATGSCVVLLLSLAFHVKDSCDSTLLMLDYTAQKRFGRNYVHAFFFWQMDCLVMHFVG